MEEVEVQDELWAGSGSAVVLGSSWLGGSQSWVAPVVDFGPGSSSPGSPGSVAPAELPTLGSVFSATPVVFVESR